MMRRRGIAALLGALLLLVGSALACGGDDAASDGSARQGPIRVLLSAREGYHYQPDHIEVTAGEEVAFRLTSDDELHTLSIPELGISETVQPMEDARFSHTFQEPGTYRFFCRIYPERMSGTLVVHDASTTSPTAR